MKSLLLLTLLAGICLGISCSSRKKTKLTTLKPDTTNPSQGVIAASGDALTIGIPNGSPSRAGSSEKATAAANTAISKINEPKLADQIRLDSLRDVDFINKTAVSEMMEISRSRHIEAKTENKKIKEYAAMVIGDLGDVKARLSKLAANKGIVLLSAKVPEELPASDAEYLNMMISDQQSSIRVFERGVKSLDPEVKAFAGSYLLLLRKHLAAAKALAKEQ